jgi:acyl-CoA thioesterase-2
MSHAIDELLALLDLEPLEVNIYRGRNRDIGSRMVFGGQVLAQALVAARRTVEGPREAHSLHGYFILPGDLQAPIVYFVDRLRDGKSFTTRRVTAIQHGHAMFELSASFHVAEEGFVHQGAMPDVPPPESLTPDVELVRRMADRIPEALRSVLTQDRPIDVRQVDPVNPFQPRVRPPSQCVWLRANRDLPDEVIVHQAVLAYASDYGLLGTALLPHGVSFRSPDMHVASLDHSLWMHRRPRADDWLLYVMDSPAAAGARGFARGSFFSRDGQLVASVAQEGLIRQRQVPKP